MTSELDNYLNEIDAEDAYEQAGKASELEELIANLTPEEISELLKQRDPTRPTIPDQEIGILGGNRPTVSFSYTNYTMEYAMKFNTVAIVSYLFRALDEYDVPDEVPHVPVEDFIKDPTALDPPEHITDERLLGLYAQSKAKMTERVIIYNFLTSKFKFNPDVDVRSAYKSNYKNPNRRRPNTESAKMALQVRDSIPADYEITPRDVDEKLDWTPETPEEKAVANNIPPVELFHRYTNYRNTHHDTFTQLTDDIYGARPDEDFAITVYKIHDTKEEAHEFKQKYADTVIADIINCDVNRWVLLGEYQKNRERIDFLNEHTEILRAMLDKREEDAKVANPIMQKKVRIKKQKNTEEFGPDDDAVKNYFKNNNSAQKYGAIHMGDDSGKLKEKEEECPRDMVEVEVHDYRDGGVKGKVRKIYNKVETTKNPMRAGQRRPLPKHR
jgi:Uri superfamily endonuclease